MKTLVENFTKQLEEALQIGQKAILKKGKDIQNVVITGLGGSGIGATIVSELFASECPIPILVNKDYFMPAFVSKHSLVIVSSYSGNTEETLHAMQMAMDKGATIVCISSGGTILELAKKHNYDFIQVPGGMPPRACLAYSLVQLMFVLQANGLIKSDFATQVQIAISLIEAEEDSIAAEAAIIAGKLYGKIPVIYSTAEYEGVAIRLRQQIQENSKRLCWHHVIPEMNHNELVGWASRYDNVAVIMFKNDDTYTRNAFRQGLTKEVVTKYTDTYIEIQSEGATNIERTLYLIHLGDWVSCYLADLNKVDAVEVKVIDHLKGSLSKI